MSAIAKALISRHMGRMTIARHRRIGITSTAAAAVALGFAYWVQDGLGIAPCALCLLERWPYRIAIGLGLIAVAVPKRLGRAVLALIVLVILADVAIAFIHVGVEQHFWPSPLPECAAPHLTGTTPAELLASMPTHPSKPCDAPTFLFPFLPISLAAMDFIYAIVFSVLLGRALWFSVEQRP